MSYSYGYNSKHRHRQVTLPEKALAAAKEAGQPADVFYAFNLLESTGTHTGSIINKNCLCECVAKPLFLGYCQCCQMANFLFLTYFKWVIREKRKTKKWILVGK